MQDLSRKYKFVFIGGLHRSGTTLLANILSQHPGISVFRNTDIHEDEGQFLQTVYSTDNSYGGPGRFAFYKKAHLIETSTLLTDSNKKKLLQEWSRYWDLNKLILLEKTPMNIIQSRFLQDAFQSSYFIFVMRHPVATSIATDKWSGTGIYSLINHWVVCHEIMNSDIPYLKHSMVINFESLISQSEHVLKEIEEFLAIANHSFDVNIDPASNEDYFKIWWKKYLSSKDSTKPIPNLGAVHEHKRKGIRNINLKRFMKTYIKNYVFGEERQMSLTLFEAQDAVEMFENRINQFGYSLVDLQKFPCSQV